MMTDRKLMAGINAAKSGRGQCVLWWLGQHGFVVKLGGRVIYIDPFLTPLAGRCLPPLLKPDLIAHADLVLGSHDHADHIDRGAWPAMAAASPGATFVIPEFFMASLPGELGIPASRFAGLNDGTSVRIGGIRVTGIPAAHEQICPDRKGRHPCLSFVVEGNGFTLFHGGDMCSYEGLQARLARWSFDLMLLPINGRDAVRLRSGCIGNLTYQEAVDLAGTLRPGLVIPTHYGMFESNTENPELFVDYARVKYPGLRTKVCLPGRRVTISV